MALGEGVRIDNLTSGLSNSSAPTSTLPSRVPLGFGAFQFRYGSLPIKRPGSEGLGESSNKCCEGSRKGGFNDAANKQRDGAMV